jgi:glucosyl-3-phosphoglycerate synthase
MVTDDCHVVKAILARPRSLWEPPCGKDGCPMKRFPHRAFEAHALAAAKGQRRVSVCLPARNEETTVGPIVDIIRRDLMDGAGLVDEILVVDDGSTDGTGDTALAAGAKVVTADSVRPDLGPGTGKGEAMWKAVLVSIGDVIAFCDADVRNFDQSFISSLVGPLLTRPDLKFVKGFYERPFEGAPGQGGRVTELTARPLLSLLFPALAHLDQPLAGEYAACREVFEQVPFVEGYGVDVGLLIDICRRFGADSMAQCDLGLRVHRNRPLHELAPQATAVIRTVLQRAGVPMPDALGPPLLERPPAVSIQLPK